MSRDPSSRRVPDELYLGSGYGNVRLDSSQFCQAIFVDRERQKIYETGTFKEKRTLLVLTSGKRGVLAVLNYFDQTVTLTISHPTPYWLLAIFLLTQGTCRGFNTKYKGSTFPETTTYILFRFVYTLRKAVHVSSSQFCKGELISFKTSLLLHIGRRLFLQSC